MCFEGVKFFYPDISASQMLGIQIPTVIYNQSYLKLVNLCIAPNLMLLPLLPPTQARAFKMGSKVKSGAINFYF